MTPRVTLGNLHLTPVTPSDARDLYHVRMHPSVRQFMSNSALIPFASHRKWVQQHAKDPKALHLWLVRATSEPRAIGLSQLRVAGDTAEIGVMFREPQLHRLSASLVTVATLHLAFTYLQLPWVTSYVIPTHKDAIDFNLAWGAHIANSNKPGMVKLLLHRDTCAANPNYCRILARIQSRLQIDPPAPSADRISHVS